jgi:hypothetical protein
VYASYVEWARWFWKGAVHIDDVAAAVITTRHGYRLATSSRAEICDPNGCHIELRQWFR